MILYQHELLDQPRTSVFVLAFSSVQPRLSHGQLKQPLPQNFYCAGSAAAVLGQWLNLSADGMLLGEHDPGGQLSFILRP
jgi:hypothetical protein